jgi:hypothetical protein
VTARNAPETASGTSLARLARWQRTADSTRRALLEASPRLPPHGSAAYWARLAMMEIAMAGPRALHVWYGDSTLTWDWYWGPGYDRARAAIVLIYDRDVPRPAIPLQPRALALGLEGLERMREELGAADSLFAAAESVQALRRSKEFAAWSYQNRARIRYRAGDLRGAAAFNQRVFEDVGGVAEYHAMTAVLAYENKEFALARRSAQEALALDPSNTYALMVARALAADGGERP